MKMKKLLAAAAVFSAAIAAAHCAAAEDITFHSDPTPTQSQTILLWDEGNIPAETVRSDSNPSGDPEDFIPNMISVPAEGSEIKGAVMISPGGAFQYRSPAEGIPVAEELSKLGYQCFVVNYRLRPYTQEEAALDLSRAVRYVRAHADDYGIDPADIAVMGFSAGGILSGELALHFQGDVNGTVLDPDYVPDELDDIPADVASVGLMYSFYGRLSVASTDEEELRNAELPPTYVLYGSNEVFRSQIEDQVELLERIGVPFERHILEGYGHGFGARGDWFNDYDRFLTEVFASDDELLEAEAPVIDGNVLRYSAEAGGDPSDTTVIAALYDEGRLAGVRLNEYEGEFVLEPDSEYMLKLFAWRSGTMTPAAKSLEFDGLTAGSAPELTEMLNNELDGENGTIHYTYYLPSDYDETKSYPMLVTLPGWSSRFSTIVNTPLTENEYARQNAEAWTAKLGDMIVLSPNLTDWGDTSARQTIELTDYFINNFSVDKGRIYAAGFSAGGETLSRVIDMRPELFAAYLHSSSQWDGGYENAARYRVPVYICMAEHDEYYGPERAEAAYDGLRAAYTAAGLSDDEIDSLLVLDLKPDLYFSNDNSGSYHSGGHLFACDDSIIDWMTSR